MSEEQGKYLTNLITGEVSVGQSYKEPSRNINIFYHVCMINDWENIVQEQIDLLLASGLMDRAYVHIGCVGTSENCDKLKWMISSLPHFNVIGHSLTLNEYEFFTLRMMHKACSRLAGDTFYGLYLHGKSVSYIGHTGGKYWRDYMGYYNITRWKDCVAMLDKGNELCGVKLRTAKHSPAHKLHYSGNFFWFRSEYIATLPPVESLDMTNRYNAELWSCMNHPIACTMCQDFVDYETGKGKIFTPPNS